MGEAHRRPTSCSARARPHRVARQVELAPAASFGRRSRAASSPSAIRRLHIHHTRRRRSARAQQPQPAGAPAAGLAERSARRVISTERSRRSGQARDRHALWEACRRSLSARSGGPELRGRDGEIERRGDSAGLHPDGLSGPTRSASAGRCTCCSPRPADHVARSSSRPGPYPIIPRVAKHLVAQCIATSTCQAVHHEQSRWYAVRRARGGTGPARRGGRRPWRIVPSWAAPGRRR